MTEFEKRLIGFAQRGELLVCPASAPSVRAELIRELLLGRHGELDPRGVQLQAARIKGTFDLDYVTASVGLFLHDCVVDEPVEARYAHLRALTISGGQCAGLQAGGVHIDGDLHLDGGLRVDGKRKDGLIVLIGGDIGGDLSLEDVEVTNTAGAAVQAERIHVNGSVFVREDVRITGAGWQGAVNLMSAHIAGDVELSGVRITNPTGPALNADDAHIQSFIVLEKGLRAVGHTRTSAVTLSNANLAMDITLASAEITNKNGCGFDASSSKVGGSVTLRTKVKINGHSLDGAIDLAGSRIDGELQLEAEVSSSLGPALNANSIEVGKGVHLERGAQFSGSEARTGAINLTSARISGDLDFVEAVVTNSIGPAVHADQAHVGGRL
ncbi:hypothetical protein LFM09_39045, partial [Lentzea alba]